MPPHGGGADGEGVGRVTTYVYDCDARIVRLIRPVEEQRTEGPGDASRPTYLIDEKGRLIGFIDAEGRTIRFEDLG